MLVAFAVNRERHITDVSVAVVVDAADFNSVAAANGFFDAFSQFKAFLAMLVFFESV